MKLNNEIKEVFICRGNMLTYFFGTANCELLKQQIYNSEFDVLNTNYVYSVFENIKAFPVTLCRVMDIFPNLEYDVDLLSEEYSEGYTSGFIRRIIKYCINNNIDYTYEDGLLFVNDNLLACNNNFLYNIFEIENIVLGLKEENRVSKGR